MKSYIEPVQKFPKGMCENFFKQGVRFEVKAWAVTAPMRHPNRPPRKKGMGPRRKGPTNG